MIFGVVIRTSFLMRSPLCVSMTLALKTCGSPPSKPARQRAENEDEVTLVTRQVEGGEGTTA